MNYINLFVQCGRSRVWRSAGWLSENHPLTCPTCDYEITYKALMALYAWHPTSMAVVTTGHLFVSGTVYNRCRIASSHPTLNAIRDTAIAERRFDDFDHLYIPRDTPVRPIFLLDDSSMAKSMGLVAPLESIMPVRLNKPFVSDPRVDCVTEISGVWQKGTVVTEKLPDIENQMNRTLQEFNMQIWWKEPIHSEQYHATFYGMTVRSSSVQIYTLSW